MHQNINPAPVETAIHDAMGRPMRDLRISVTDTCNLRCPYCMPQEEYGDQYEFLSSGELLSFSEIARLAGIFTRLGVSKIRLTGGEPLLRPRLPDLVRSLQDIEGVEEIALTTNGVLLAKHAHALRQAGLTRITVSLDSLDPKAFGQMNGRGLTPDKVLAGLDAALDAGFTGIKLNVVVQRGMNEHTLMDLIERFRGTDSIVRFIEYMDVGNRNGWRLEEMVPSAEIVRTIHERYPLTPLDENYPGEVATRYAFEDGAGEIGFISSVTEPFCGSCTRARLSADGRLYTCLFASTGADLRTLLRAEATDEELLKEVVGIWTRRADRYSELRASGTQLGAKLHKVEMYQIGG
ncbi:MAG: GTP 3',8-cyclase MoaA [Candidatus Hydrogenedentes bacterium]|nr:GTP 3',8-cyclase MoaA [Candidatus Hydrogenedentota bacterium]